MPRLFTGFELPDAVIGQLALARSVEAAEAEFLLALLCERVSLSCRSAI
jgi:hypothetical protein